MQNKPVSKKNNIYKIIVIGGGAAGLIAAISAAEIASGKDIAVVEKNEKLGRKLLATGNGRCNFTNRNCSTLDFKEFSKYALKEFGVTETLDFFEGIGVFPKEEDEGRMYPYSEQASAVQTALTSEVELSGAKIYCKNPAQNIKYNEKTGLFEVALQNGEILIGKKIIITTGGKAGIQYGSDGDGYKLAKFLGHNIVKPIPSLVALLSDEAGLEKIKGVRATGKATLLKREAVIETQTGEIQFTGEGISGICIFNLSGNIRMTKETDSYNDYSVEIDLFPEIDYNHMLEILKKRKDDLKNRKKDEFLIGIINEKLGPVLMVNAKINLSGKVCDFNEADLKKLCEIMKKWKITIAGTKGWKEAQVTSGGIDTSEINSKTMESKIVKGIYFAGELIDIDGKCGGYNLQWAWSSGKTAGKYAALSIKEN